MKTVVRTIFEKGFTSGEFVQVDINTTSDFFIATFNGLMRQQVVAMDTLQGVKQATIEFFRNALMHKND